MIESLWIIVGAMLVGLIIQIIVVRWDKHRKKVLEIATEFVDRMEGHREELRWDDPTFRLLFELIKVLRECGFDAAPWWKG